MCIKPVDEFQAAHLRKGEQMQQEIFRKMTPGRKLEIAFALYRDARGLKAAWLRQCNPDWTEEQVEAKVSEYFGYSDI
ncbi:MAG: hypothetical protein JXD22_00505 [Sedimentisphaerales bacterium]|nr:hypothetical protein [Sedimentisphaerales bacterium]